MKHFLKLVLFFGLFFGLSAQAAERDSTLKNTIRINITPILVTSTIKSFTMGYERVLKPHLTISANVGHLQLPSIVQTRSSGLIQWNKSKENTGYLLSTDLRFYFKRNRYIAPDGLYWGPYLTYYKFINTAEVSLKQNNAVQAEAALEANFGILMTGVQLGYQFVLGKRWTIDLIFLGPGVGFYNATLNIDADGAISDDAEYIQAAYDAIVSVFPGAATLMQGREYSTKGSTRFTSLGFRYVVQVGFRF